MKLRHHRHHHHHGTRIALHCTGMSFNKGRAHSQSIGDAWPSVRPPPEGCVVVPCPTRCRVLDMLPTPFLDLLRVVLVIGDRLRDGWSHLFLRATAGTRLVYDP